VRGAMSSMHRIIAGVHRGMGPGPSFSCRWLAKTTCYSLPSGSAIQRCSPICFNSARVIWSDVSGWSSRRTLDDCGRVK
jgi:hypothetical protein